MTPAIEPLTDSDVERCAALEAELFAGDDPWSARAFRSAVRSGQLYLAARDPEGALVGYAGLARVGFDAEVHTLAVDPRYQGRGIGRALLDALLDAAGRATVFLEVRTDNHAALALYRSAGFTVVGTRPRYYQPSGADAYTMRRDPTR